MDLRLPVAPAADLVEAAVVKLLVLDQVLPVKVTPEAMEPTQLVTAEAEAAAQVPLVVQAEQQVAMVAMVQLG